MRARRLTRTLAWLLLVAAALLWRPLVAGLPVGNEGLAAQAYEGWAGVIRVWVCGGWQPGYGSFVPWLNEQAARFERRHPGVYVQMESVTGAAMRAFYQEDLRPDAILFAPGMLDSAANLAPLDAPTDLLFALEGAGDDAGTRRAVPVAMGGYAWAVNRSMLGEVPLNWATLEAPAPVKKQARYLMQVPADDAYHSWSAALNALCAPRRVTEDGAAQSLAGEGVNLGLPKDEDAAPTPEPTTTLVTCDLPAFLPDNFRAGDTAYVEFTKGLCAAIPVTQREIRRLQVLSESGRAPDWAVEAGGAAFTDQLLMMGVPLSQKTDGAARQALAEAFLSHLLTNDSQKALSSIRALRVTQGDALYQGQAGMGALETSMRGHFTTVNVFSSSHRAQAAAEADRLQRRAQ